MLRINKLFYQRTYPVPYQGAHGVMQDVSQLKTATAGNKLRSLYTQREAATDQDHMPELQFIPNNGDEDSHRQQHQQIIAHILKGAVAAVYNALIGPQQI